MAVHTATPAAISAQGTPADTAAVLYDVARQLEEEGRLEEARLLYRLIQERYPESYAAGTAGLRLVATATPRIDRSGRTELLVWSTLYGLWLGAAVPAALDADGLEPYGVGLLLGGPAGFLAARNYTRTRPVSEGQARAITFGGSWGTWQAFGWREVFDIGEKTQTSCLPDMGQCIEHRSDPSSGALFGSMILGGLAGVATGAAIAGSRDIAAGDAAAVNYAALWGTWYGVVVGVLADLDGDGLLAAALLGGDVGLGTAAVLAPDWGLSVDRVRLISIAGVAGGLAGAGLDLLLQPGNDRVAILIPAITSALGLALGVHWTRDRDASGLGDSTAGSAGDGALVDLRDGRWSYRLPQPVPVPLRNRDSRGWSPGLRVELLHARF